MVSYLSIGFMIFSLVLAVGAPIGLIIYLLRKDHISLFPVVIGALTFVVFQVLLRIPILGFLGGMPWYQQMAANIFVLAIFLSVTAGIAEEVGRFLSIKFLVRKQISWKNGIAFGLGHGGIEAMIFFGIPFMTNLVFAFMINQGTFDQNVGMQLGEGTIHLKNELINTPAYMFLLGGVERVFAIVIHVALSLVVMYGVLVKRFQYVIYAILIHTFINIPAALVPMLELNILYVEGFLFVVALIGLLFIRQAQTLFANNAS